MKGTSLYPGLFAFLFTFLMNFPVHADRIYVDSTATGVDNGTSWTDAFTDLQDAIDAAAALDSIFVARGTYYPSVHPAGCTNCSGDRDFTFLLPDSVSLFGGFPSGGSLPALRDWQANPTILDGDIGTNGDGSDNLIHVLMCLKKDSISVLDGFIIQNGNANAGGSVTVKGNVITRQVGAGLVMPGTTANIRDCRFSDNHADRGAAIDCSPMSFLAVTGGEFHNNTAINEGGAIRVVEGTLKLGSSTFSANQAESGGGIYLNTNAEATVTASTFQDNTVSGAGGAFENKDSEAFLDRCVFTGNTAGSVGGAIQNVTALTRISRSSFTGNEAFSGGAIKCNSNCDLYLDRCTFLSNEVTSRGAALNNDNSDVRITSCLFAENEAGLSGGVLENTFSQMEVINSTCTRNSASSSDFLRLVSSTTTITNSIFWDHDSHPVSVSVGTADISYSIVEGGYAGMQNFDTDPMFVDTAAGDYSLLPCSPAINAGINDSLGVADTLDLAGRMRIHNGTVDMGAYEYQNIPLSMGVIYVDSVGAPGNAGSSWQEAIPYLEIALLIARLCPIDTIKVAKGTYAPHGGFLFSQIDTLLVQGGYDASSGTYDPAANKTILSGLSPGGGDTYIYATHVITVLNSVGRIEIDGVTISDGRAISAGEGSFGGGVLNKGNLILRHCHVTHNYSESSGAVYALGGDAWLWVLDTILSGNTSGNDTAFSHQLGSRVIVGEDSLIEE